MGVQAALMLKYNVRTVVHILAVSAVTLAPQGNESKEYWRPSCVDTTTKLRHCLLALTRHLECRPLHKGDYKWFDVIQRRRRPVQPSRDAIHSLPQRQEVFRRRRGQVSTSQTPTSR
jgi:hypothetical protein